MSRNVPVRSPVSPVRSLSGLRPFSDCAYSRMLACTRGGIVRVADFERLFTSNDDRTGIPGIPHFPRELINIIVEYARAARGGGRTLLIATAGIPNPHLDYNSLYANNGGGDPSPKICPSSGLPYHPPVNSLSAFDLNTMTWMESIRVAEMMMFPPPPPPLPGTAGPTTNTGTVVMDDGRVRPSFRYAARYGECACAVRSFQSLLITGGEVGGPFSTSSFNNNSSKVVTKRYDIDTGQWWDRCSDSTHHPPNRMWSTLIGGVLLPSSSPSSTPPKVVAMLTGGALRLSTSIPRFAGLGAYATGEQFTTLRSVEFYDIDADEWLAGDKGMDWLPIPLAEHGGCAVDGGQRVVIGGGYTAMAEKYVSNPRTFMWMPNPETVAVSTATTAIATTATSASASASAAPPRGSRWKELTVAPKPITLTPESLVPPGRYRDGIGGACQAVCVHRDEDTGCPTIMFGSYKLAHWLTLPPMGVPSSSLPPQPPVMFASGSEIWNGEHALCAVAEPPSATGATVAPAESKRRTTHMFLSGGSSGGRPQWRFEQFEVTYDPDGFKPADPEAQRLGTIRQTVDLRRLDPNGPNTQLPRMLLNRRSHCFVALNDRYLCE